ncbi:MAG: glycosyltransferase [candidate division WOR-3 bacterium]
MKLLCVTPSYYPAFQFGGPIFAVHNLNKALVKKGVDVTVYTTNVGLDTKAENRNPKSEIYSVIDGVKVYYFTFVKFLEFLGTTGWQFSLPMARALNNNIKMFDIIYIVSTWNFPVALASYFCRKYKKPYIISPRGHLYNYVLQKKSWKKLPYYYLVLRRDLQNASAIHYTTEDEAEQSNSALGLKNKYFVIPNGIDLTASSNLKFKQNKSMQQIEQMEHDLITQLLNNLITRRIILFLGRIHWIKGLDILIPAYAKLLKEYNDLHLIIAGNDEAGYIKKVQNLLLKYNIQYLDLTDKFNQTYRINVTDETILCPESIFMRNTPQVTFTGMLTGSDKLEILSAADIFVLPSYSENFGMSVIEAMACGIPVVISNKVGIYREVEKNSAGIVVDANTESIYKGIKILLEDPKLRRDVAINGRKLVEKHYDIEKIAMRMIEVYNEILSLHKI